MKYKIYGDRVKLFNSYAVPKSKYSFELKKIRSLHPDCLLWGRSEKSICREWASHTLAYVLGIRRERTADCDLNFEQKWYVRLGYWIVGNIALLVIK